MNNTLDAAKSYVARGISILPLKEKSKIPAIPSWKEYQTRKPTEDELVKWFGNGSRHNIGIVTGGISGLAVVDLDSPEAVEFVKAKGGLITPTVKTGKGFHLYCLYQDGIRNFQKRADLPGIDLRGEGGYVVAPPSIHESGHVYQWGRERGLDIPLAGLPSWILAEKPEDKQPITELYNGIEKGSRNMALARLAGSWVNDGGTLEDITHQALLWNQGNRPPLPEHEVRATVKSIFDTHNRRQPQDGVLDDFDPSTVLRSGADLMALNIPIEWAVKDIVAKDAVNLFYARGGMGKSTLSTQLAACVVNGEPFLGIDTTQMPVIYIDFENSLAVLSKRLKKIGGKEDGN